MSVNNEQSVASRRNLGTSVSAEDLEGPLAQWM